MLGKNAYLIGLVILTVALFGWRAAYHWLVRRDSLQDSVYVLGIGDRALRLVQGLRERADLGMRVVSWTGEMEGPINRDTLGAHLLDAVRQQKIHHVIVALADSRGNLPVKELLHLRLQGVKIEEATSLNERISGKIEVEHLYPSWLIYADGFRFSPAFMVLPFEPLWSVARCGRLRTGDAAPDFDLSTLDRTARVRLSSFEHQKPVVLIFGSYT